MHPLPALAAIAVAALSGDEILARADDAATRFTDLVVESTLTIHEPGDRRREVKFTSTQKGEKRLVRFTAPDDLKGMGFFAESRDVLYAYLPAFNKVRRLGTHVKNQSFMGSDIIYEELAQSRWGAAYSGTVASEDDAAWVLDLSLKPGVEAAYAKLKLLVDKKSNQVTRVESYDGEKKVRTQLRSEFRKAEGKDDLELPGLSTFIDHARGDHKTELRHTSIKANTDVPDGVMSVKSLKSN